MVMVTVISDLPSESVNISTAAVWEKTRHSTSCVTVYEPTPHELELCHDAWGL